MYCLGLSNVKQKTLWAGKTASSLQCPLCTLGVSVALLYLFLVLYQGGGGVVPKLCLTKRDSHVVYKSLIIPKDYD